MYINQNYTVRFIYHFRTTNDIICDIYFLETEAEDFSAWSATVNSLFLYLFLSKCQRFAH